MVICHASPGKLVQSVRKLLPEPHEPQITLHHQHTQVIYSFPSMLCLSHQRWCDKHKASCCIRTSAGRCQVARLLASLGPLPGGYVPARPSSLMSLFSCEREKWKSPSQTRPSFCVVLRPHQALMKLKNYL